MLGVALSFYKKPLNFVPVHVNTKPVKTLDLPSLIKKDSDYIWPGKSLEEYIYRFPLREFTKVDFETLCKIRLSNYIMMDQSVEKLFEEDLHYSLFRKISSSIWRWGYGRGKWNDVVSAYNCIKGFQLTNPNFKIRLDYSTHYNEKGYSEFTRTYLDGALAFLVYYKNQHVMTLGFSVLSNRRILVQQVQMKNKSGNRWLFKLPSNYLEYVLDSFFQAFPKYRIYLVDGQSLAEKYEKDYSDALKREKNEEYKKELRLKVEHIQQDSSRIATIYSNPGHYRMVKTVKIKDLFYHQIERDSYVETYHNESLSKMQCGSDSRAA